MNNVIGTACCTFTGVIFGCMAGTIWLAYWLTDHQDAAYPQVLEWGRDYRERHPRESE